MSLLLYLIYQCMLCPDTPPADDRDCQFLTCHADLDNRRLPRHKRFFSIQSGFFRWKPIFLGLFERNLERAGIWRWRDGWASCPPRIVTTLNAFSLSATADSSAHQTPSPLYGPSLDARSRGRRRNRSRFAFKPSDCLIPRIISRVSLATGLPSQTRPVCGS